MLQANSQYHIDGYIYSGYKYGSIFLHRFDYDTKIVSIKNGVVSWSTLPTRAEYDALNSKTAGSGTAENEYCTITYSWTALANKVCLVNMTFTPKTTINSSSGSVTLDNLPFLASRTVTGATYDNSTLETKGVCILGSSSKNVTFLGPRTLEHSYHCGFVYL